jgi:hypothetical protein
VTAVNNRSHPQGRKRYVLVFKNLVVAFVCLSYFFIPVDALFFKKEKFQSKNLLWRIVTADIVTHWSRFKYYSVFSYFFILFFFVCIYFKKSHGLLLLLLILFAELDMKMV